MYWVSKVWGLEQGNLVLYKCLRRCQWMEIWILLGFDVTLCSLTWRRTIWNTRVSSWTMCAWVWIEKLGKYHQIYQTSLSKSGNTCLPFLFVSIIMDTQSKRFTHDSQRDSRQGSRVMNLHELEITSLRLHWPPWFCRWSNTSSAEEIYSCIKHLSSVNCMVPNIKFNFFFVLR